MKTLRGRSLLLKTKLVPYFRRENGEWSIHDDDIRTIFSIMEEEGSKEVVFRDGKIRTGDEFISLMQSDMARMYLSFTETGLPSGFFYLNWFEGKSARVHFCMFKKAKTTEKIRAAKDFLKFVFSMKLDDGQPMFDVLIGVTPVSNGPASSLSKHLGFEDIGIQPCTAYNAKEIKSEDVYLRYIKPDMLKE